MEVKLNTDRWDDQGNVYEVIKLERYINGIDSTAVRLTLMIEGVESVRVVAENQIEWID